MPFLLLSLAQTHLGHTCLSGVFLGHRNLVQHSLWNQQILCHYQCKCMSVYQAIASAISDNAFSLMCTSTFNLAVLTLGSYPVFYNDCFKNWLKSYIIMLSCGFVVKHYLTCLHRHLSSPSLRSLFLEWFTSTCTVQMAPWMATQTTRCLTSMWVTSHLELHRPQPSSRESPPAGQNCSLNLLESSFCHM